MLRTLLRSAANVAPALVAALFACSGDTGSVGPAGSAGASGANGAAGQQGPSGAQGSSGVSPRGTLSAVVPAVGLLARDLDVTVLGDGTKFDSSNRVDFGQGISVTSLTVISSTGLRAHLQIDPGATVGSRDVIVRTTEVPLVGRNAFQVGPSMMTSISAGAPQQGGVVKVDVENLDTRSFGTTALIGAINSLGAEDVATAGASSTGTRDTFIGFVDPLATPGSTRIEAVNVSTNNDGATVFPVTYSSVADAVEVLPVRSIEVLTVDSSALSGTLAAPFATHVYRTSTPSSGVVSITLSGTGARIIPRLNIYPTSGRSNDFVASTEGSAPRSAVNLTYPVDARADTYAVVCDTSLAGNGGTDYAFAISASFTHVDAVPETIQSHYATAQAQPLCESEAPDCLLSGNIRAEGEYDVYVLPPLPPDTHRTVFARLESDARVWLTTDPWMKRVDNDFTPAWPQHVGRAEVASTDVPTYVIVHGRAGGAKPVGAYLLATTMATAH